MKINQFKIAELFNNSCGKTSLSLVCAAILVITGCAMGIKSAWNMSSEIALQALGFATLGSSLLGLRRFTKDKSVAEEAK